MIILHFCELILYHKNEFCISMIWMSLFFWRKCLASIKFNCYVLLNKLNQLNLLCFCITCTHFVDRLLAQWGTVKVTGFSNCMPSGSSSTLGAMMNWSSFIGGCSPFHRTETVSFSFLPSGIAPGGIFKETPDFSTMISPPLWSTEADFFTLLKEDSMYRNSTNESNVAVSRDLSNFVQISKTCEKNKMYQFLIRFYICWWGSSLSVHQYPPKYSSKINLCKYFNCF